MVPDGHCDDLYCIVATLVDQTEANRIHLEQSLPKIRTVLISNDKFRDHQQYIRDRILFQQWYRYHCSGHIRTEEGVRRLPEDSNVLSRRTECNGDLQLLYHDGFLDKTHNALLRLAQTTSSAENELKKFLDWLE